MKSFWDKSLFCLLRWLTLACLMAGAASSSLAAKTYTDNGDGTVTDPTTGLQWMRCAVGQTWNGSTCTGTAGGYSWDAANMLTGSVTFAGKGDWRVPSIRELQTIVDRTRYNPAIDPAVFPNISASGFWSASIDAFNSYYAWYVDFSRGYADGYAQGVAKQVRLVRSGQSSGILDIARPSTDYVDQGNGTVTHTSTGLMWQRCAVGQSWTGSTCSGTAGAFTWDAARLLTSTLAGKTDWRLPTEDELLSLADYSKSSPAINITLFPNTTASGFWSASIDANKSNGANGAWYVNFGSGSAVNSYTYVTYQVRLVRSGQSFDSFALTVTKTGNGSVTSSPAGIDCGAVCSASFNSGSSVTLTATAATGSTFAGWSGGECSGTGTCTLSMNQTRNVAAAFTASPITIIVIKSGTGSGVVSSTAGSGLYCGNVCSLSVPNDSSVTLTATATTGSTFAGWSGDCAGAGTAVTCTVSMSQARSVTATFTANTSGSYTLSVTKSGSGSVVSTPSGINCGAVCATTTFASGASVTLTATPDAGNTFGGWGGACSGTATTCTVAMNQARSVTATFAASRHVLIVASLGTGSGTVASNPSGINCGSSCSVNFDSGTSVILTAMASTGSSFNGWSGDCSGTAATCTVSLSQARSVTATFAAAAASTAPGQYDGIYQWDTGYYLSVHQIGGGNLIATIYWVYAANSVPIGTRTISEVDTFDLLSGPIVGSTATMTGTRFYRGCTPSYNFAFSSDSLTVRLNSISNSPGVSVADVDCAARYNPVGATWSIPKIY